MGVVYDFPAPQLPNDNARMRPHPLSKSKDLHMRKVGLNSQNKAFEAFLIYKKLDRASICQLLLLRLGIKIFSVIPHK